MNEKEKGIGDIKRMVDYIGRVSSDGDFPSAHRREHDLFAQVLTSIAMGEFEDPKGAAAECIKSLNIKFRRNYRL